MTGTFQVSGNSSNRIQDAQDLMIIPNFVTTFEQRLVRKPHLRYCALFPRLVRLLFDFDGSE